MQTQQFNRFCFLLNFIAVLYASFKRKQPKKKKMTFTLTSSYLLSLLLTYALYINGFLIKPRASGFEMALAYR